MKIHKFFLNDLSNLTVELFKGIAHFEQFHSLVFYPKNGIIYFTLAFAEFPTHRKATRKIGSIVGVFSSHIKQQYFSGLALLIVFNVVQHIRVKAGGDDRAVGKATGAVADEFVYQFGLYLIFPYARFYKSKQAAKSFFSNVAGLLNQFNF